MKTLLSRLALATALASACLGLLGASPAFAAFEQAASPLASTFAETGEEVQLGSVSGMAVNSSGAGGALAPPAGTVYGVTQFNSTRKVIRFVPGPNGSLKFSEAWEVQRVEGQPYGRCGPESGGGPPCSPQPVDSPRLVDVDVNPTTGNVYVFVPEGAEPGQKTIIEYSPDGSEVIARFGEAAAPGETTPAAPAKVHAAVLTEGIAVDGAGNVYIFDRNPVDNHYRLMTFRPQSPGDYTHYVYAGEGADIAPGVQNPGVTKLPTHPVVDSAGNIYVNGDQYVQKYDPAQPASPVCSFALPVGGITAMTVDPVSEEPFYYTAKTRKVHQLGPCNGEGKFAEVGSFEVAPPRDNLWAMVFDPVRQFPGSRPPGVLYGAAPGPENGSGKGEPGKTSLGYIFAPIEENPPLIVSESVSGVGQGTAELHAEINPKSVETRYVFQYLTTAAYKENGEAFSGAHEAVEAPLGGGVLGSGNAPLAAAAMLSGLAPDTEYRFRVLASNCLAGEEGPSCEATGATQSFRTFPPEAVGLPDGRAYELVSPAQKNGGQVLPAEPVASTCLDCKPGYHWRHFPMQSTPDGEAVLYEGGPFAPGVGATVESQYIARRGASGWSTQNVSPSLLLSGLYEAFSPDLAHGVLGQNFPSLSPAAPPEFANLYRQPSSDPAALEPLLQSTPPNRGPKEGENSFVMLYSGASRDLSHIVFEANDALTEATPFAPAALDGGEAKRNLYEWADGQLSLVNVFPGNLATAPGASFGDGTTAISADGSRVFWSSEAGQLYVRIDGTETVEVADAGKFLTASADGSRVLLSDGCLYDVDGAQCEDLTAGQGGFVGVASQTKDLTQIYFVDSAVLTGEEENDQGAKAQPGKENLYAWDQGTTTFIGTLSSKDSAVWSSEPRKHMAEASPNGKWLAFLSKAPLTGYDNAGPCEHTGGGETLIVPCQEAFLYDSDAAELVCASCNPDQTSPLGSSVLRTILNQRRATAQPRYLTDSGRLYFDTQSSLVSADTNGGVEDVYQYEPQGVGSCAREPGCVSLISSGREGHDSNFLAVDEAGDNVFFTTADRLLPADKDELFDLYDARVGGGFAQRSGPAPAEQASSSVPAEPTAGSQGFVGPGIERPRPRCRKGRVRRGGHCAKKAKHKKRAKANKHARGAAR